MCQSPVGITCPRLTAATAAPRGAGRAPIRGCQGQGAGRAWSGPPQPSTQPRRAALPQRGWCPAPGRLRELLLPGFKPRARGWAAATRDTDPHDGACSILRTGSPEAAGMIVALPPPRPFPIPVGAGIAVAPGRMSVLAGSGTGTGALVRSGENFCRSRGCSGCDGSGGGTGAGGGTAGEEPRPAAPLLPPARAEGRSPALPAPPGAAGRGCSALGTARCGPASPAAAPGAEDGCPRHQLLRPAPLPGTGWVRRRGRGGRSGGVSWAAPAPEGEGRKRPRLRGVCIGVRRGGSRVSGLPCDPRGFPGTVPRGRVPCSASRGSIPPGTRTNPGRAAGSRLDPPAPAAGGGDGSVSAPRCPAAAQPGKHSPARQRPPGAPRAGAGAWPGQSPRPRRSQPAPPRPAAPAPSRWVRTGLPRGAAAVTPRGRRASARPVPPSPAPPRGSRPDPRLPPWSQLLHPAG